MFHRNPLVGSKVAHMRLNAEEDQCQLIGEHQVSFLYFSSALLSRRGLSILGDDPDAPITSNPLGINPTGGFNVGDSVCLCGGVRVHVSAFGVRYGARLLAVSLQTRGGALKAVALLPVAGEMALLMEHQFRQMPADRQVETRPFLEAVSYLPPFFDCLGSAIFAPIKADISGNITKIKAVYDTNPGRFKTLQHILEAEKEIHGAEWPKAGATLALLWLKRGLRFIQVFLQSLVDGDKDDSNPNLIRVNVTKAYEIALKKYHGWFVQQLFKAALYAAPYKTDFLKALSKGRDVKEEECLEKIRKFLVNFTATVDAIYEMYSKLNADLDYTV